MKNILKHAVVLAVFGFAQQTLAQSSTEVAMVAHSTIDVKYKGEVSYIDYLNQRNLSKDNVYKDYYTEKFVFDLGKLKSGTVKEIDIPLKNASDTYIKITAVNEICACLSAQFPGGHAATFKPGETKVGKLKFSTKGLSGKVRRAVEVRTYTNMKEINYLVWVQAEVLK